MAATKSTTKPAKKGSKLASLVKSAMSGLAAKKKAMPPAPTKKPQPDHTAKNGTAKNGAAVAAVGAKKGPAGKVAAAPAPAAAAKAKGPAAAPAAQKLTGAPKAGRGRKAAALSPAAHTAGVRAALEAAGETVCREVACEGLATSAGYCRLHYIKNWTKIKRKVQILKEGKLNQYIEELVAKYPDKYLEAIRQDLASDKEFAKVIHDLDLDEGVEDFEGEGDSIDSIVGDIKREFDDEGEAF